MIKGFLVALESTMGACDRVSTVAGQLLASQRENRPVLFHSAIEHRLHRLWPCVSRRRLEILAR